MSRPGVGATLACGDSLSAGDFDPWSMLFPSRASPSESESPPSALGATVGLEKVADTGSRVDEFRPCLVWLAEHVCRVGVAEDGDCVDDLRHVSPPCSLVVGAPRARL